MFLHICSSKELSLELIIPNNLWFVNSFFLLYLIFLLFATKAYNSFKDPVAVENIKANAGLDIGGTLIGMHLKTVAVPVKLSINKIGQANLLCARTRPKYIGGERAKYSN